MFCLVGVAKGYQLNPRRAEGGFIYTYRYDNKFHVVEYSTTVSKLKFPHHL